VSRRAAAGAAAVLLLGLLLGTQAWGELPRRWRKLSAFAPKELAVRRLGGSGTAFDRRYFSFLENARRRMPKTAKGVVVVGPYNEYGLYLTTYHFAPLPVSFYLWRGSTRPPAPRGWVVASYGADPLPGQRLLARLPEGVLWEPAP
jgi:hypothetical protein